MTVSLLLKYACIILIHNVVGEMPKSYDHTLLGFKFHVPVGETQL